MKPLFYIANFVSILFFLGCSTKTTSETPMEVPKKETIIDSSYIEFSKGGGFTGLIEGCTLFKSGKLTKWKMMPGKEKEFLSESSLNSSEVNKFFENFADLDILESKLNSRGNVTYNLMFLHKDKLYKWTWTNEDQKTVPGKLKKWINTFEEFCKSKLK